MFRGLSDFIVRNKKVIFFWIFAVIVFFLWDFINIVLVDNIGGWFKRGWLFLNHILLKSHINVLYYIYNKLYGLSGSVSYREIHFHGGGGIIVANNCLGLNLMYYYVMFILISPFGRWKNKLLYSIIGVLYIHILNHIRMILLMWLSINNSPYLEINHYFIFNTIVYLNIGMMWYLWMRSEKKYEMKNVKNEI